jgi:hypothetical protein
MPSSTATKMRFRRCRLMPALLESGFAGVAVAVWDVIPAFPSVSPAISLDRLRNVTDRTTGVARASVCKTSAIDGVSMCRRALSRGDHGQLAGNHAQLALRLAAYGADVLPGGRETHCAR